MGFPCNSRIPLQLCGHVHLRRKSSMMKYLSYILLSFVILSRFGAIALASENASVSSSTPTAVEGAEINEKTSTTESFPYHQADVTALSMPENIEKQPEPITPFYTDTTSMATTLTTNAINDRTSISGQLKDRFANSSKEYSTIEVPMTTTKLLVSAEVISLQLMETIPTITTELTDPENTVTWSDDATSTAISVQTTSNPRVTMRTIFTDEFSNQSGLLESHLGNDSQRVYDTLWPVKHASVVEGDVILGGLMMVHSREDSITCGPIMPQGGIQALEAMLFTLDQINEFQLLPNITLGAHILDDCDKDTYGLEMAVDFIKVFGFDNNGKATFFLRDPLLIKQLTIKDFDHFMDHQMVFFNKRHDPFFGNTLVAMEGQHWRDMRSALSPAFTGSKMRLMFELVNSCGEQTSDFFMEQCRKNGSNQSYDMKDIFSKFANDVIATCAFGVKCDSLRNPGNDFFTIGKELANFQKPLKMVKLLIARMFPDRIATKLFDLKFINDKTRSIFSDIIDTTMKTREEKGIFRPDMINLLMELKKGQLKSTNEIEKNDSIATADDHEKHATEGHRVWSDDELIPQCFVFFLAGFDTSSTFLTFLSYELAVNPDVQSKLQNEIDEVDAQLLGKPLTYDLVQTMTYLDMVVAECLRKWPPAFMTDRLCVKDYAHEFEDGFKISIDKGGSLMIPIFALQRDPKYFPEPDKFDPERFSKENKSQIAFNSYIPFGVGPRNCIGSRFALMEAKVVIYHLLRKFSFEVCEKTQVPLKLKKTLSAMVPEKLLLTLKPRKQ